MRIGESESDGAMALQYTIMGTIPLFHHLLGQPFFFLCSLFFNDHPGYPSSVLLSIEHTSALGPKN